MRQSSTFVGVNPRSDSAHFICKCWRDNDAEHQNLVLMLKKSLVFSEYYDLAGCGGRLMMGLSPWNYLNFYSEN